MDFEPIDAAFVEEALQDAGVTLAAMRASGHTTHLRVSRFEVSDDDPTIWAHNAVASRPALPNSDKIDVMDSIFRWLLLIENQTIRRIVAGRAIVDHAGRPQSWRSIARRLGVNHHSVKSWHACGIANIVAELNRKTPP